MNYANKYRPSTFDDVIGQENTITILSNQVKDNNIKNAYLFVGSAGTGKTTTARIFANMINHGKGNPIEIDAASNTGIDNIREIREQCKFKPIDSQYKVYIIDETHMLSLGAFNGFLKTLEEPPKHCVFILCTTDPQKIPMTIISRCQRFDFKRVPGELIAERLRFICRSEGLTCDNDVIDYIARTANGGVRSAISLLDTCSAYGDLTVQNIENILGKTDSSLMSGILKSIEAKNDKEIINIIEALYAGGKDLKVFLHQFLNYLVDIQKFQITKDIDLTSLTVKDVTEIGDVKINVLSVFEDLSNFYYLTKYEHDIRLLLEGKLLCMLDSEN